MQLAATSAFRRGLIESEGAEVTVVQTVHERDVLERMRESSIDEGRGTANICTA
jgi:hypothetical protein